MNVRNSKIARALGAGAIIAALSGCGAVAGLIPDQSIRDPLKLNAVSITATVGASRVYARAEKLAGPYPNLSSIPIAPKDFRIDQPLRAVCRIRISGGTLPPTLTLRDLTFGLTVTDADGTVVELPAGAIVGPLECTLIPESVEESVRANYAINATSVVLSQS